jgi:hypothetical protein
VIFVAVIVFTTKMRAEKWLMPEASSGQQLG